jgi:hypothetical protein
MQHFAEMGTVDSGLTTPGADTAGLLKFMPQNE